MRISVIEWVYDGKWGREKDFGSRKALLKKLDSKLPDVMPQLRL